MCAERIPTRLRLGAGTRSRVLVVFALVAAGCGRGDSDAEMRTAAEGSQWVAGEGAPTGTSPPASESAPGWALQTPIYTVEQAERGAGIFLEICSACHVLDDFTSFDFRVRWVGTVGELYGFMRSGMPQDSPGRLEPEQYADALAFILRENGLPAGDLALGTDLTELNRHRLESPGGP